MRRILSAWWHGRFLEIAACRLMGHEPIPAASCCAYCGTDL